MTELSSIVLHRKALCAFLVLGLISLSACAATSQRQINMTPSKGVTSGEKVEVKTGDTVYSVARRYGVSMRDIIAINKLQAPFTLAPGTRITLPAKDDFASTASSFTPEKPRPSVELGPMALDKDTYDTYQEALSSETGKKTYEQVAPQPLHEQTRQKMGDATLNEPEPLKITPNIKEPAREPEKKLASQIQKQADDAQKDDPAKKRSELAAALNLKPLAFDKNKKQLKQPPAKKMEKAEIVETVTKQARVEKEATSKGPPIYSAAEAPPLYKKSELGLKPLEEPKDEPKAEQKKPSFIWPVQGPVISTFGPKSTGLKNDGVNIGAPRGTPVVASDGGTVAYAGSGIPGYGNVVLVRHPSGMMTTYAHLERMFVQADTVVAKGDMVGSVGTSGGMDTPQLHFEIRRGNEALDPSKFLYQR